jgi:hypothetical protein
VSKVVVVLFFGYFVAKLVVFEVLISQFLGLVHIFELFVRREHSLKRVHEWVFALKLRGTLVISKVHAKVHRGLGAQRSALLEHVMKLTSVSRVFNIAS